MPLAQFHQRAIGREGMNSTQRLLVVASLVVIGLVLAIVYGLVLASIECAYVSLIADTKPILMVDRYIGLGARYGIAGILLGVIAPLCLFAAAAFVALGTRKQQ